MPELLSPKAIRLLGLFSPMAFETEEPGLLYGEVLDIPNASPLKRPAGNSQSETLQFSILNPDAGSGRKRAKYAPERREKLAENRQGGCV